MTKVLVTGAAGFIGSHVVERLLAAEHEVIGLDNLDDFYSPAVKRQNLSPALENPLFRFIEGDIRDPDALEKLPGGISLIIHLAARAGVRPSIEQPLLYQEVNVRGTQQLLEYARSSGASFSGRLRPYTGTARRSRSPRMIGWVTRSLPMRRRSVRASYSATPTITCSGSAAWP
jgi:nucleoside-diphosphate-sugar epimerase